MINSRLRSSGYQLLPVSRALVNVRRLQAQAAIVLAGENQVAAAQFQFGCAVKLQFGLRRVGAGGDAEVVFQTALVSIKNQIDSGIDTVVANSRKLRNAGMPMVRVVAEDVVALARQRIGPIGGCRGIGTHQLHTHELFAV
jgi:hypothetical protein